MTQQEITIPQEIIRSFEAALREAERAGKPVEELIHAVREGQAVEIIIEGNEIEIIFF